MIKRPFTTDVSFVLLTALIWLLFFAVIDTSAVGGSAIQILFSLGAGSFSFLFLNICGYFGPFRLVPRKSDLLLVLCAIPLGGGVCYALFRIVFSLWVCPLSTILIWTPILAMVTFGSHYYLSRYLLKKGHSKKIVLDLLPQERADLIDDFAARGHGQYLEFLSMRDLRKLLLEGRAHEVSMIVISRHVVNQFDVDATLLRSHLAGIPIVDHRKITIDLRERVDLTDTDLWTYLMVATPQTLILRAFSMFKAVIEPAFALALGILLAPVILTIAIVIRLTSSGPVFYKQVRTGHLGKNFTLYKFRSMRQNSEVEGPRWASANDDRVTKVGQVLRRYRLDELPQLWNVIKGEMSFVGPRPERPEIYGKLKKEIPLFSLRTIVRPGVTGWAQVCAGYAASVEESQLKLEFDLFYIQHMSPRLDMVILLKTLKVALFGSGSSERVQERVAEASGA